MADGPANADWFAENEHIATPEGAQRFRTEIQRSVESTVTRELLGDDWPLVVDTAVLWKEWPQVGAPALSVDVDSTRHALNGSALELGYEHVGRALTVDSETGIKKSAAPLQRLAEQLE
jgi:hypothetical protein